MYLCVGGTACKMQVSRRLVFAFGSCEDEHIEHRHTDTQTHRHTETEGLCRWDWRSAFGGT